MIEKDEYDTFCLQFCHQQQPPRQIRAIYLRSDVDDETWTKLDSAAERGYARYVAAMKKGSKCGFNANLS